MELITILVFNSDYFQEKLMTIFQIYQKRHISKKKIIQKKLFGGNLGALFPKIWAKMNFPGKKGSVSF